MGKKEKGLGHGVLEGLDPITRGARFRSADEGRARRGLPPVIRIMFDRRKGSPIVREIISGSANVDRIVARLLKRKNARRFTAFSGGV